MKKLKGMTLIVTSVLIILVLADVLITYEDNLIQTENKIYFFNNNKKKIADIATTNNVLIYNYNISQKDNKTITYIYLNNGLENNKFIVNKNRVQRIEKGRFLDVKDISQKKSKLNAEFMVDYSNKKDFENFESSLNKENIKYFVIQNDLKKQPLLELTDEKLIMICTLVVFLISINTLEIRNKTKEFAIKKMNNYSNIEIIKGYTLSNYIFSLKSSLVSLPVSLIFLYNLVNIQRLLEVIIIGIVLVVIIMIIYNLILIPLLCYCLLKMDIITEIKQKKSEIRFFFISKVALVLTTVVTIVSFSNLKNDLIGNRNIKARIDVIKKNDSTLDFKYIKLSNRSFYEKNTEIAKLEEGKLDNFVEYLQDECNAIYSDYGEGYIEVNKNYLKVMNKNKYKANSYTNNNVGGYNIKLYNPILYHYSELDDNVKINEIIVRGDGYSSLTGGSQLRFDYNKYKKIIDQYLLDNDIKDMIIGMDSINDDLNYTLEIYQQSLIKNIFTFIFLLFTMIFSCYIYMVLSITSNEKEIVIKKLYNYNFRQRYNKLIIDAIYLIVGVWILSSMLLQSSVFISIIVVVLIYVINLITISTIFEKRMLINILKGE